MRSKHLLLFCISTLLIAEANRVDAQAVKGRADEEVATAAATLKLPAPVRDYVVGPEDILNVNVWKEPEISRTLPVSPDGKISLPLVGELMASGHTATQLQNEIKERLLTYFSDPEVNVSLQEAKSHKFNIVGEVEKPGFYLMTGPLTVLDAIAIAGGLRDFAKVGKIYVLRPNADGTHTRLPFNYKRVIKGSDLRQNVELQPRDTIVVP